MTTIPDMRQLRKRADTVMKSLLQSPDEVSAEVSAENDDSDHVWFEKLEQQTSQEVGYPTPVKTPGSRSYSDVDRYRHNLPKVSEPIREEITEFVEQHFKNQKGRVDYDPEFTRSYGMDYVGGGSFRKVFEFYPDTDLPIMKPEDVVLKVAGTMEWTNKEEARIWSKFTGTELAQYLAPVIDIGPDGNWVLMKKVDCDSYVEMDVAHTLRDKFEDAGWEYHDLKDSNIGFNENGDAVLVDYGYDWSERDDGLDENNETDEVYSIEWNAEV